MTQKSTEDRLELPHKNFTLNKLTKILKTSKLPETTAKTRFEMVGLGRADYEIIL